MAIFGKNRKDAGTGLGRSTSEGEVIDITPSEDRPSRGMFSRPLPTPPSEAEEIVAEVSEKKLTRAEKKALAQAEKLRKRSEKSKDSSADQNEKPEKKSRKALKAEREAIEAEKDNHRLSNMVMIDFYPGVSKQDAIETARHWAMTHMDMPSLCSYYVLKIRDGFAIEVQEGVGKAYLPSVIELAQANPGRLIVVPMVRRKMTVFYSARLSEFEAQILPELQEPPSMPENPPLQALRGPAMTPIMKQYKEWLVSGVVTAAIGGLALLSSIAFYAFDTKAKVPPQWRTTDVALLPVMQWNRLQPDATDSYVTRLEFQDGQWRVVRQAVAASVDIATPESTDSSGAIVGGIVPPPAPGSIPDANGAIQGVPTNIPPPTAGPN
jgi:hypothetical protein